MTIVHLLRRLAAWLRRHLVRAERTMSGDVYTNCPESTAEPVPPVELADLPAPAGMSPEQAAALARVRSIYHSGTQPLTVARARYDLLRRGAI